MTLAEKIAAKKAEIVVEKDALQLLHDKDDPTEEERLQMNERSQRIERMVEDLETMLRSERALALGSKSMSGTQPPATQQPNEKGAPAIIHTRGNGRISGFDLLVRTALCAFESYQMHQSIDAVAQRRYPNALDVSEAIKLTSINVIERTAQNPAMTSVAGWAAELVRESYGAFMDALAPESVLPRLPLMRYEFDGFGKINLPQRQNRYPTEPNLAAFFRAEGAPIRVGRTSLTSKYLTPKSAAVIGTFTKELLKRSTPNIEEAIRNWMLEDTAIAMDTIFLDAVAGDAIRPAGIQYGMAAGDTAASSGNTGQDIVNDITGRLKQLSSYGLGRRPVWVMNQSHAWGVSMAKTPTGEPQFPDGKLAGIPVVASTTVPMGIVFLIDAAEIGFAGGAPSFEGTDVATIHEDDGSPNADGKTGASVLPIVDGAGAVAKPVRSLFQTHSAAIKAFYELDWAKVRDGAVQTITGVTW